MNISVNQSLFLWNTRLQMCIAYLSTQNIFVIHLKYLNIWQQKIGKKYL